MADSGKESKETSVKETGKEKDTSASTTKRKRGAAAKKEKEREKDRPTPSAPPMQDIKLPDKYRLLPVPKADAANAQPDDIVQLSRTAKAAQITLQEDMLTASGCKGYRMVRATHGVASGSWYFEVKVNTPQNGEDGHTRLGWCTEMGELQAPVGYDQNSYSYRDRIANAATDTPGCRFHDSTGVEYGGSYGPGDVIGCWLKMGPGTASVRSRQRINIKGVEYIVEEERERTPSVGSHIAFFKNGEPQGTAFEDVWAEVYYPAASLFRAAAVTFNFGPTFAFPPGCDARPVCELAKLATASDETAAAAQSDAAAPAEPAAAEAADVGVGDAE